jgi:hypothetical protein
MKVACLLPGIVLASIACAEVDTDVPDAPPDLVVDVPVDGEFILEELQREQCNNQDDDGNGRVDDGAGEMGELIEACSTSCGDGWKSCFSGEWWPCSAGEPRPDGTCPCPEEGKEQTCTTPCGVGMQTCLDGRWTACSAGTGEEEICDNNIDDDCDGEIDEGECGCEAGSTKACGSDTGECEAGTQSCRDGSWQDCVGDQGPEPEECNGLDDDCDGTTDNVTDGDRYEENDACTYAARVPDAPEDGAANAFQGTMAPAAEEDWYFIKTVEGSHWCVPMTEQCCFTLRVVVSVPEGTLPLMCLYFDGCAGISSPAGCTSTGQDTLIAEYSGTCSLGDDKEFALKLFMPSGQSNCHDYTVTYTFTLED